MNRGRSKFTSGGVRRQGTEVHEDRRTRRRRTRADVERAAVEEQGEWGPSEQAYWENWWNSQAEINQAAETPRPKRRRA